MPDPLIETESLQRQALSTSEEETELQAQAETDETELQTQAESGITTEDETLQRQELDPAEDSTELQAKLSIGQPGDKYEREADSMAMQVMKMPETSGESEMVQRTTTNDDETDTSVQAKPLAKAITKGVQLNGHRQLRDGLQRRRNPL
ncbi:hypothetical protein [Baaleninema simplex]|uniref:hypothetical protein n=1 Tax=Baaleninema simplex TaxID=2862350 RepID=UPI00034563B7|nr:hypothetical protein [Baaleninema simplex]